MNLISRILSYLSIYLGRWFGVPVILHWSWVISIVVMAIINYKLAFVFAGLFLIVLLHECGHCLAGKYYGSRIRDIVLYPFGGAASMEIPSKPWPELVVALAGPAVNVLFLPVFYLLRDTHWIFAQLEIYNLVLLIFNLLPAFPMDGGRVFRALLTLGVGDYLRATTIAVRTGQGFFILFGVVGFFLPNPMLMVIGFILFGVAEEELEQAKRRVFVERFVDRFQSQNGAGGGLNSDVEESASILRDVGERLERMEQRSPRNRPLD
jgi:Zn-dependent protease